MPQDPRPPAPLGPLGRVRSLHRKPEAQGEHGLPKPSVRELCLTVHGAEGDFNRYRHEALGDDPHQALLLMTRDNLDDLRSEGWPIEEGDLGENITADGIAYRALAPGTVLEIGSAVVEVSKVCTPCDYLYALPYVGPGNGPRFLKALLDRRGWYASVRTPGTVRVGDQIRARRQ